MDPSDQLNLTIALPLRNQGELTQLLKDLGNPASPKFRHYITPDEFAARFGPTRNEYQAVIAFARSHGFVVRGTHPNRTLLDLSAPVAAIDKTFGLTMQVYRHPNEARTFHAPNTEPTLNLSVPVLGISGLNDFARPQPRLQATLIDEHAVAAPNAGSGPSGTFAGNDFRAAYVPGTPLTGSGQSVGLVQFDGYSANDITYYESHYGLPNVPLVNVLLDGFNGNPSGFGGEVEVCLDIEAAISMAPGLSQVIVYMAGPYGSFHDVLNRMATDNLAKQLSCSWYIPGGGADAIADQIFQQMAAQGQSFFNASGDYDAFTGPVDFPGETPYITQVGGTMLTTTGPGGAWVSERVWNRNNGIGTGGGISTRYAIPSYQTNISMALNQGSTTMRNIPDVALTAENVEVRANGRDYNVGGTSCSAPLWGGFCALVNQQAVASGRPTVGFVNQALDTIGSGGSYTTCFHDITVGDNTSSGSPGKFHAATGYDLCTGWGTPAGSSLITALATPDALIIDPGALAFSGDVGGPFTPNPGLLTLTNIGTNTLSWTLVNTSALFTATPAGGSLQSHGPSTNVSVSVTAAANSLSAGLYSAVLKFTNLTGQTVQARPLTLSVAATGMADDFEPDIDLTQWSSFGGMVGTTVRATNYGGSISAPNSLWFGDAGSRFATTIPVDTVGGGQIGFCLRLANGTNWPWAKASDLSAQGVVLEGSTNGGGSWTILGAYNSPAYYNWTGVAMAIPAVAQSPATLFRWRQPSNGGTNSAHWALDNVFVGTGLLAPKIVMDPQNTSVIVTETTTLSVAAVGSQPLSYQWFFNGTNLDGATSSSIVFTNVQFANSGTYSVFVSNSIDSVLSSNAILTVNPAPPCAPPPVGLVSWWRAEGNSFDQMGTNNGTLVNGATFAQGRVGQSFSFNGTNAYVSIPKSSTLDVGAQVTIEFWMNADISTPIGSGIVGLVGSDFYGIEVGGSPLGVIMFMSVNGGATFPATPGVVFPAGEWHHIAGTYDGAKLQLYLDGQPAGNAVSVTGPISPMLADSFVTIGSEDGRTTCGDCIGTRYFKGLIDEPTIYNRALSGGEIAAIYNAGLSGKCPTSAGPAIYVQPTGQTVTAGTIVSFSVTAGGTPPLSYQWQFNGTNLAGATTNAQTLANVQVSQSGSYTVQVTNLYGSVVSSNAVLTVNLPPPCAVVSTGLVSWWNAEGQALDSRGTNNGILVNGATFAPGEVGQAFSFDGVNDYVQIPKSASLDVGNQVTVEFWMKADPSTPIGSQIVGLVTSDFYGIEVGGSPLGVCMFMSVNGGGSFPTTPSVVFAAGEWHHIAGTYNGTNLQLYIDALPVGPPTAASGPISPMLANSFVTIGSESGRTTCGGCGGRYFKGQIDEPAIYNRALSASEIQTIYAAGAGGKCGLSPVVFAQPQDLSLFTGFNATFNVLAGGTPVLNYQWSFNGTNLVGATTSSLTLSNLQVSQAGTYSVQISNYFGSAVSSNAVLSVNPPPACATVPSGLVSWWAAEGSALDSNGTNNGTLMNGATFAAGKTGQAFSFDGINDYVKIPKSPSLDVGGQVTIDFWMKADPSTPIGSQIAGLVTSDFYGVEIGGSPLGVILFMSVNNGASFPATPGGLTFPAGEWHHVAATYDGSKLQMYLDGQPAGSPTLVSGAISPMRANSFVTIGSEDGRTTCGDCIGSRYFKGQIDEVDIFNRALSASEIAAIYAAGANGKCGLAPAIVASPQNQTNNFGTIATFTVGAGGTPPLSYQWLFNGTNIASATNSTLSITNVQVIQAGTYAVQVTNLYGSALSFNAVLVVNPPPACSTPAVGLVSWWAAEGNALDSYGANNATLMNGATFAAGEVGQAFSLDGANDYVKIPKSPSLNVGAQLTIEFWMKADPSNPMNTCCQGLVTSDFYLMEISSGNGPTVGVNFVISTDGGASYPNTATAANGGGAVVSSGVWHHIAGTYDGTKLQLYVDGQPWRNSAPASGTISSMLANSFVSLGSEDGRTVCGNCVGTRYFKGLLDEVDIYNRALSAAEIAAIYNASFTGKCVPQPVIQTPPQNKTGEYSSNVTFSVSASGALPLAYRWYFGTNLISGATNALLTLTNVTYASAGQYSVIVTNIYGGATGGPANLTVVDTTPPTIFVCASNQLLSVGANCTATLPDLTSQVIAGDATGPITITQNPPPGTVLHAGVTNVHFNVQDAATNISGCNALITVADTTPPFIIASVSEVAVNFNSNCLAVLPDLTTPSFFIASDNCGSVSITQAPPANVLLQPGTNVVIVTFTDSSTNQTTRSVNVIVPTQPHIALQPTNLSVIVTSNGLFNVLACGAAPLRFQWQRAGTNLPYATNALLSLTSVTTNDAGSYTVIITNTTDSFTSDVAVLTVLQPPVITRQPSSIAAAPGGVASFSVAARGLTPFSFQWQKDGSALSGQTRASITLSNVQVSDFGSYSVGITNTDGGTLSQPGLLTLAASPYLANPTINLATFTISIPTEVGPIYVLEYKELLTDPAWTTLATVSGTGSSIPVTDNNLTNTSRFYRVRVR